MCSIFRRMLTSRDFQKRWREFCPIRFPADDLRGVNIPHSAKAFLVRFGLPDEAFFRRTPHLPPLPNVFPEQHLPDTFMRYRHIGEIQLDYYTCFDELSDGCLVNVNFEEDKPSVKIFHSSVEQYVECCFAWQDHYQAVCNAGDALTIEQVERLNTELEESIRRIDPAALSEGSWWSRELEIRRRSFAPASERDRYIIFFV